MKNRSFGFVIVALASLFFHQGAGAFTLDFNGDEVGGRPAGAKAISADGDQVSIVLASEVPGQPFGADAGNVLALLKGIDHEVLPRVSWAFEPMSAGVVSLKAATPALGAYGDPLLNIFLCHDGVNAIGPSIYVAKELLFIRDGDGWKSYEGVWKADAVNDVRIEFFNDQTYQVSVNGEAVPDAKTRFRFHMEDVQEINFIQFSIASTTNFSSNVFVDDVTIHPTH